MAGSSSTTSAPTRAAPRRRPRRPARAPAPGSPRAPRAGRALGLAAHPLDQHGRVPVGTGDHVARQRVAREEREADTHEVGEALLVHPAVEPLGHRARLRAAEPLVPAIERSATIRATGAARTSAAGWSGWRAAYSSATTEPKPRPSTTGARPDRVAEILDVVRPALDPALLRRAPVAATAAAEVGVDDLRPGGEPRAELHLEEAVVEPVPGGAARPSAARASRASATSFVPSTSKNRRARRRPGSAWGYTTFSPVSGTELEPPT